MIVTFTDFGWQGTYIAELELCIERLAPGKRVIHLMKDAPAFNPVAAGIVLAAHVKRFPKHTVFLGVVDPGVGSDTQKPVVLFADDRWYVGPGNGLFDAVAINSENPQWFEISWRPDKLSESFHGRDLFAPIAVHVSTKCNVDTVCTPLDYQPSHAVKLKQIVYIDHYGNCITGISGEGIDTASVVRIGNESFCHAKVFSDVSTGTGFWYVNSAGLLEIAVNQGSAEKEFGFSIGMDVYI